jgi:predicted kinase
VSGTVHIICGLPGSGKSDYAKTLEKEKEAVLFSQDEWMIALLGKDHSIEQFERFVLPCQDLIWEASLSLLDRNIDVIFDFAIYSRKGRKLLIDLIKSYGAEAVIYCLNVPHNACKERLSERNRLTGYSDFSVTEERFDELVNRFDQPSEDEGVQVIFIENT